MQSLRVFWILYNSETGTNKRYNHSSLARRESKIPLAGRRAYFIYENPTGSFRESGNTLVPRLSFRNSLRIVRGKQRMETRRVTKKPGSPGRGKISNRLDRDTRVDVNSCPPDICLSFYTVKRSYDYFETVKWKNETVKMGRGNRKDLHLWKWIYLKKEFDKISVEWKYHGMKN